MLSVEGKIFFSGENGGTIYANTQGTLRLCFLIGFGYVYIRVKADDVQKEFTAFAFGPLFFDIKEI